ncbi:MAG: YitT family protein [Odoribacter sp.]
MYKKNMRSELKAYFLIAFGMLIYAVAATGFLVPHRIVGGGATGLSTIIYYLSGETVPVGVSYFLINIILVSIALKILGPKFGIKTIFAIIVGSIFLSVMQPLIPEALVSDKFMSAIIAGMMTGLGIAIAIAQGGSTGGTDIVAMIITKYKNVSPGKMIMYCDCCIIASSLLISPNIEGLMYGFVMMGVVSFTIDFVLTGKKQSAQLFIFTDKYAELAERITQEVNHGVSVVDCKGWFSGQTKKMLIVVVRKNEAIDVLKIAKQVDPNVFMTMNTVMGVFGRGFEEVKG